jgi:hypothetical protein
VSDLTNILQNEAIKIKPLPIRLKPKPDELTTSWLTRLAMAHGIKLHAFCSIVFPNRAIWDRDIDKSADDKLIYILAKKTLTTFERATNTTLSSYEGIFFETYNRYGPTAWILPIGIYSRFRRHYGQQFCALCLAEDSEPYYRRRWRMAFMVCCDIHGILLFDRCPDCSSPINFHRDELGDFHKYSANTITQCYMCGLDFCYLTKIRKFEEVSSEELNFTRMLLSPLEEKAVIIGNEIFAFPHLFFIGFRHLTRTLALNTPRIKKIRNHLADYFKIDVSLIDSAAKENPNIIFEKMNLNQRRQLLNLSRGLLSDWSNTFLKVAKRNKVWSSVWLKHLESDNEKWGRKQRIAPYWYYKVIRELYRPIYYPTEQEIKNAIAYIEKTYGQFSKVKLRKFFGEAIVYRKLKQLLETE